MAKKTTKKSPTKPRGRPVVIDDGLVDRPPAHDPPLPLAAIIGQDRALGVLRDALASGRVHHCWLFSGPPGVGKFATALALAAVLLDPAATPDLAGMIEADPDGPIGRLLASASHPDLHIIRKELAAFSRESDVRNSKQTNIPIDVLREFLIEPAALAPALPPGGLACKVFIIDEAELLGARDPAAQNALLKTLEEPPPGTVIILVTASEDRLLPTIRSRSQRVVFLPLSNPDMRRWADARGLDLSPDDMSLALRLAGGSPGTLMELIEDGGLVWYRTLEPMLEAAARGDLPAGLAGALNDMAKGWSEAWAKADPLRSKDVGNRIAARRLFRLVGAQARQFLNDARRVAIGVAWVEAIGRAEQRLTANMMLALVFEGLAADLTEAGGTGMLMPLPAPITR